MDYEHLALKYHATEPVGKISVTLTKPLETQTDLSVAYSPGVAGPCRAIERNPTLAYSYTSKGNLVAVISNGTAVLGLGHIGALASKPVMEGKAMLFKKFANVDAFDIEIDELDTAQFVRIVKSLEPTFGGINLEDIRAPECFIIEERLKACMNIPVFHDDQHGTAIIASAGLVNALEVAHKDISQVKIVFSGAGASAIACADMFISMGVRVDHVWMCDTRGLVHSARTDLNVYKAKYAKSSELRALDEVVRDADVFVGLSSGNVLTPDMLRSMRACPIVFALANPDPEIRPELAHQVRDDVIIATGRSDYPNQINNVLGFPYIFRGALDTRARTINETMKYAAAMALAQLAKEPVHESVRAMFPNDSFVFGPRYIIPKPTDPRALVAVSSAVACAAMDTGVATRMVDMVEYTERLRAMN